MDAVWSQTHAHISRGLDGLASVLFLEMLVYPSNSPKAMSPISKRKKKKSSIFISILLRSEGRVRSLGKMSNIKHEMFRSP